MKCQATSIKRVPLPPLPASLLLREEHFIRASRSRTRVARTQRARELRAPSKSRERYDERCDVICRLVDGDVFAGMDRTQYLSLADNEVPSIPRHILSHMSLLRTLDLSRNRISRIDSDDFKVRIARAREDLEPRLRFVSRLAESRGRGRERENSREVALTRARMSKRNTSRRT